MSQTSNNNDNFQNQLYFGDNLDIMKEIIDQRNEDGLPTEFIDLIYIDPPFNSKRDYSVFFEDDNNKETFAQKVGFTDTWSNITYHQTLQEIENLDKGKWIRISNYLNFLLKEMETEKPVISYLSTMAIRIIYMRKLLKKTGSFYLHCDPTMSHDLKKICDFIFGKENFRNEICWIYRKWNVKQKQFPSNHDTIFYYTKTKENTFNTLYIPKSEKSSGKGKSIISVIDEETGKRKSIYSQEDSKGTPMPDWFDVPIINPVAKERLGYPTQKPLALLDRIIRASSNPGDIVADFFCGCGTTIESALNNKRHFVGCDISFTSVSLIEKRISNNDELKDKVKFNLKGIPKDTASAKQYFRHNHSRRLEFENYIIEYYMNGFVNEKRGGVPYDGYVNFETHNYETKTTTKHTCYIECKSGEKVAKNDIRAFGNTIQTFRQNGKDCIGLFVVFEDGITAGGGYQDVFVDLGMFNKNIPVVELFFAENFIDEVGKPKFLQHGNLTTHKINKLDKKNLDAFDE